MLMIRSLILFGCLAAAFGAESTGKKAAQKPAAKAKPAAAAHGAPKTVKIPATAREIEPGAWLDIDSQGKRWIYRTTPFGIARMEDKPAAEPSAKVLDSEQAQREATTASEDGDLIHFIRPGPFGSYKWTKKKSDLDEQEKLIWKREQERAGKGGSQKPE